MGPTGCTVSGCETGPLWGRAALARCQPSLIRRTRPQRLLTADLPERTHTEWEDSPSHFILITFETLSSKGDLLLVFLVNGFSAFHTKVSPGSPGSLVRVRLSPPAARRNNRGRRRPTRFSPRRKATPGSECHLLASCSRAGLSVHQVPRQRPASCTAA